MSEQVETVRIVVGGHSWYWQIFNAFRKYKSVNDATIGCAFMPLLSLNPCGAPMLFMVLTVSKGMEVYAHVRMETRFRTL